MHTTLASRRDTGHALNTTPASPSPLDLVGNTPLIALQRLRPANPRVAVYAKAEWWNPGGSVKDRAALAMIRDAERRGVLRPGRTILDATSGNTGIAYAMMGAILDYRVTLCVPANVTPERKRILNAYGVELILTDALESSDGAIREARRLYAQHPERYVYLDQYNNPANWRAHYETTAEEIWEQTEGRVTHFVAGLGTSGTFTGTARRLKEINPAIRTISFQPDDPFHGLEGLKHMASAIVPGIYDPSLANQDFVVSTEEAYTLVRRLAVEEGLLVGISSGAAVACALHLADRLDEGVIVTIFPDSGDKYLSERFWEA
ncbi:MAG: cysteine synthase [Luteitalea sp.]|nr:cysteine synthase [Luteitalea sp.]